MTSKASYVACIIGFVLFNAYFGYKYSSSLPDQQKSDSGRQKKAYVQKSVKNVRSNLPEKIHGLHKSAAGKTSSFGSSRQRNYELEDYFQKLEDIDFNEGYNSIENVDESRIEEVLSENDKNVVIFFYDRDNKCPDCRSALEKMEDIDDELESTGYIEVVKSRDLLFSRELGVYKFPAMVYFRRRHPILYDGDFRDSQEIYRWVRAHDQVVTVDLEDRNFEEYTDSYSPSKGNLDWFILFFNSKNAECFSYIPMWETVAYRLRGYVNVAKVDIHKSDDVAHRFKIDEDEDCPTFILMRKGKIFKYKQVSRDVEDYVEFALQRYKEQRGKRVPQPPTLVEELYEEFKEYIAGKMAESYLRIVPAIGLTVALSGVGVIFWWMRRKNQQQQMDIRKDS